MHYVLPAKPSCRPNTSQHQQADAISLRGLFYLANLPSLSVADETVSSELKKQIMSARLAKKLTQAQLANTINEKPQVIQEYESGKVGGGQSFRAESACCLQHTVAAWREAQAQTATLSLLAAQSLSRQRKL